MALTLDQVFVTVCERRLTSTESVLAKARALALEQGGSEGSLMSARLTEDMWALPAQIQGLWAHTAYAVEQVRGGEYRPNPSGVPETWDGMYELLRVAREGLPSADGLVLESIAGDVVSFVLGGKTMFSMTVQDFLLSFSMPNVHFHATTAYDLLRMKGCEIGKFDFLGSLPVLDR